jgi:hypothetical protein
VSGQDPICCSQECDISIQFFVSRDTKRVGKVTTRGLATLESRGVIEKAIAHPTLTRAWSEAGTEGR